MRGRSIHACIELRVIIWLLTCIDQVQFHLIINNSDRPRQCSEAGIWVDILFISFKSSCPSGLTALMISATLSALSGSPLLRIWKSDCSRSSIVIVCQTYKLRQKPEKLKHKKTFYRCLTNKPGEIHLIISKIFLLWRERRIRIWPTNSNTQV